MSSVKVRRVREGGTPLFARDDVKAPFGWGKLLLVLGGILFALLEDGRRAVAKSDDPATLAAMAEDAFLGSQVTVHADRSFSLA